MMQFGMRWRVHRVVDPARREGSLGYVQESPRRRSSGTLWVCRFFLARNICSISIRHPILEAGTDI